MAPALCFRILEHLEELGLLQKGDCLLDPMAGTGMTGLVATVKGYPSILVELEPRFCEFIRQNKEALEKKLGHAVDITCIQGDSRHLSELLSERGLIQVCSPPYGDIMGRESHSDGVGGLNSEGKPIYGANPANIGNLKEGKVMVTSPPYEGGGHHKGMLDSWGGQNTPVSGDNSDKHGYGSTKGQIEDAENYWSAMSLVYAESLRCCDVLAVVVKDPTRKGKLHPLGELTWRCLEAQGWRIVDYHQAILFTETEQGHLFDGKVKKVKGRLSFFKRLSYQKGSPVANCEHVIIAVNPNGRRWGKCQVTSPPYGDMLNSSSQHGNSGIAARDKSIGDLGRYASQTPGQIGNMPEGIIQIVSPPYSCNKSVFVAKSYLE